MDLSPHFSLARRIAGLFAALPQVEAVALGGSQAGIGPGRLRQGDDGTPPSVSRPAMTDAASDIDLYVFTRAEIPLAARQAIVEQAGGASRLDLGLAYWGPGDEWYDLDTGIEVDLVYFDAAWMEAQIARVVEEHQPSLGYTTCLWRTVSRCQVFQDPHGWLTGLQVRCAVAYPEALRRNIIDFNHPVLRGVIPSYYRQIEKAVQRGDLVSANHRLAALLASYFDILFAFNRVPHPGEKRLLAFRPGALPAPAGAGMGADLAAVLAAGGMGRGCWSTWSGCWTGWMRCWGRIMVNGDRRTVKAERRPVINCSACGC